MKKECHLIIFKIKTYSCEYSSAGGRIQGWIAAQKQQ